MSFSHVLRNERFEFPNLRDLLAKANEEKSGDRLAGLAASSERQRVAAKLALADVPLKALVAQPVIDPDIDDVSKLIAESHDLAAFSQFSSLTVGELREWLLAADIDHPVDWPAVNWLESPKTLELDGIDFMRSIMDGLPCRSSSAMLTGTGASTAWRDHD